MGKFKHDYSKCMMTKLYMSEPDGKGGSKVYCDFEQALEIIKTTDNITHGIKKIIYLVGWQYNGHDDQYPAFHKVNANLKRDNDKTALDSMLWLIEQAKKFNTIVSVHINFADAYTNCELFEDYVKAKALIRTSSGLPAKVEKYNGMDCYKVSYKEEWESGLFQKRLDKIIDMLPLAECGTIHVDNLQCYFNRKPYVSIEEMMKYRALMIEYAASKGIDITTEFIYREGSATRFMYGRLVRHNTKYPIALLDKCPAFWLVDNITANEAYDLYPTRLAGGIIKNKKLANLFYGNMHAEDLWKNNEWTQQFIEQFMTVNLPYFLLSVKERVELKKGKNIHVVYSDGTVSYANGDIIHNGQYLKQGGDVCMPYPIKDTWAAYSINGCQKEWFVGDYRQAEIFEITPNGYVEVERVSLTNGKLQLVLNKKTAVLIKLKK